MTTKTTKAAKAREKRATDKDLRERIIRSGLLDSPDDKIRGLAHAAVLIPSQHGPLARRASREAQQKIAAILDARAPLACPDCGDDEHDGACEQNFCRECGVECGSACSLHPTAGVRVERTQRTTDLHTRIAKALGWTAQQARSMSYPTLRDLVRPVNAALAAEISEVIRTGSHLTRKG